MRCKHTRKCTCIQLRMHLYTHICNCPCINVWRTLCMIYVYSNADGIYTYPISFSVEAVQFQVVLIESRRSENGIIRSQLYTFLYGQSLSIGVHVCIYACCVCWGVKVYSLPYVCMHASLRIITYTHSPRTHTHAGSARMYVSCNGLHTWFSSV